MSAPSVKICGVRDAQTAIEAARAGADFLGFVFFRKSPRFVSPEAAEEIILDLKQASFDEGFTLPRLAGLFVDAGEKELSEAAPLLTHFQFHGHENAARCQELGAEFGVDVIKAVPVTGADDVTAAHEFAEAADIILFDAKPPPGAGLPGGNGVSFDWSLLAAYKGETPYLVAGGLTPQTVAGAVAGQKGQTAFLGVDVSSGVETAPGEKNVDQIKAFIAAAKQ
ncbi:phosphoribosylanthranilate isomerase [Hyphococcus sp.]|uniref:phosphoribosylanthranilate isomerase n=1 Tax=Hyphococcus sp. TaxID=2038636 RepID=UPI003CCC157F